MENRLFTAPNILTLMNLLCGSLGVVSFIALDVTDAVYIALLLMLAAALFDFLDGFVARLTKSASKLGAELDSLADVVSFGLLPAIMALKLYGLAGGEGAWGLSVLIIALFSALRLARFNVDDRQHDDFIGLPTPANALLIASAAYAAVRFEYVFPAWAPWAVIAACVALALLLVSPVRMFSLKFKGFGFRLNAVRYIFLLVCSVFLIFFGLSGIAPAIILYILSSVIMWLATPPENANEG